MFTDFILRRDSEASRRLLAIFALLCIPFLAISSILWGIARHLIDCLLAILYDLADLFSVSLPMTIGMLITLIRKGNLTVADLR